MSFANSGAEFCASGGSAFPQPSHRPANPTVMAVRNSTRHYCDRPRSGQACVILQTCPRAPGGLPVGMRFALLFLGLVLGTESAPRVGTPPAKVRKALKLDAFYTKHVDVEGFAVVGSKRVADAAMLEAAYLIRRMLGGRKDILRALAKNKVRFVVIAHNEYTTDIPEYKTLQPRLYWNRRARGLGPSKEIPAVSCGEENLLCYPGDPYGKENILIHEFAHAIHSSGLSLTDPTFDERLEAIYEAAVKDGLWKGKYAGRNHHEYWAEGVQSWFGTNRENDHDHNHVNTRAELKAYDPRLAKLVKEVFGEPDWRYQRPAERRPASAHLKGYQPAKAPTFAWSKLSDAWYKRFQAGLESMAPDHAVTLELLSPESENWRSPRTPDKTRIYVSNASKRSIRVEWIDFDGKPRGYGAELRPTDHTQQQTFAGHVWRLVDDASGEVLHYFLAPKRPGKLIFKNPK